MALYVTGDLHANSTGEMSKLNFDNFPEGRKLTKEDYVVVLGDFGFIWSAEESKHETFWLNWLNERPWTTLFIDGNHENFDRLDTYPAEAWHGGQVQYIRPSVIHLMRGQVFNIDGKKIFTMGGAPSHDIQDGILDPMDENFLEDYKRLRRTDAFFRVKGVSWWPQEEPNEYEWRKARINLLLNNNKVDYIFTHEAPASVVPFVSIWPATSMSKQLEELRFNNDYKRWFFAHYHIDKYINDREMCLYNKVERIF